MGHGRTARVVATTHVWMALIVALALLATAGPAWAQRRQFVDQTSVVVVTPSPSPATFGTADEVSYTIPAQDFGTANSSDGWTVSFGFPSTTGGYLRYTTSSFAFFVAGVRLPAGAEVTRLQVSACDGSPTDQLGFFLGRVNEPPDTGAEPVTLNGTTGAAATPGCGFFEVGVDPAVAPLIIDNVNNTYVVVLSNDSATTFSAARVFYRLRVSPAPSTATFGDVPPTHPFFRFIEALVASGITAGCSAAPPLYCPDDLLTRGQMAVFLSKALGLHTAP
jgi:hypothetical protein